MSLTVVEKNLFMHLITLAEEGNCSYYSALEPLFGIYRRNYGPYLKAIAFECDKQDWPFINCLIQRKSELTKGKHVVGEGYYIPCPQSDLHEEMNESFLFDWSKAKKMLFDTGIV